MASWHRPRTPWRKRRVRRLERAAYVAARDAWNLQTRADLGWPAPDTNEPLVTIGALVDSETVSA